MYKATNTYWINWNKTKHNGKRFLSMSFLKEFFEYLKVRKKYWLLPIMLFLFLLGGLLIVTEGTSVAPLIYTIFYDIHFL